MCKLFIAAAGEDEGIAEKLRSVLLGIYGENPYFYITTGSQFEDVYYLLTENEFLIDNESFLWLSEKKNYKNNIYPGRYLLESKMNNNQLIDLLRSGQQEPVKVIFNNIRTKLDLAGRIGAQIEADSIDILEILNDKEELVSYNLNENNVMSLFIPNTYEFYWNTSANNFMTRMSREFDNFWNENRLNKLERVNLNKIEVMILASVVEQETQMNDEKERLAGVYINRIRKGMRLQADPTIKFALGDFEIKRVLTEHLSINSPYNTYKHKGLPPGPICIPSISSIESVLNFEEHNYLYFCAKYDFSGYHAFAKNLQQHNINAEKYQKALNKNRVFK